MRAWILLGVYMCKRRCGVMGGCIRVNTGWWWRRQRGRGTLWDSFLSMGRRWRCLRSWWTTTIPCVINHSITMIIFVFVTLPKSRILLRSDSQLIVEFKQHIINAHIICINSWSVSLFNKCCVCFFFFLVLSDYVCWFESLESS